MLKKILFALFVMCFAFTTKAQEKTDSLLVRTDADSLAITLEEYAAYEKALDSIVKGFTYEYGEVELLNGKVLVNVPEGFMFLNAKDSKTVLEDIWDNPPTDDPSLGMLFPKDMGPLSVDPNSFAIDITYSDEGYISDEDAKDIDYTDLMKTLKQDTEDWNDERVSQGYEKIHLIGWASEPYYDAINKKLHWAQEYNFEGGETNILNYNIRVLGRNGYLNLNVIGDMAVLPSVKKEINPIIENFNFTRGNTYAEHDPSIDKVAAYGIGGLIAGKVLAKTGFFALLLKFWKVIAIAAAGGFAAFRNKIFGSKDA
ncbi:DUF2167 domain-containing protein [Aureivirga sp. CE67]|uniref:DUF2167 domain-containing protein n=1 Tax=Aureivirga sp. CE67 TaxID=1788983 RepID=UPI0018CB68D1|nr:DUF2167 domain-containing protein [Aureivirga sp. CE67]